MCLRKGSRGETGTWKSLGGSEELASVLLGKKRESKQYLVLQRERVSRSAPAPLQSHPHPTGGPGSPQLCDFSCWAVRRARTWMISAPQSRRWQAHCSLQAHWQELQKGTNPHAEPGAGRDACGAWFGPGGVLVSRWAAEIGWMHHV